MPTPAGYGLATIAVAGAAAALVLGYPELMILGVVAATALATGAVAVAGRLPGAVTATVEPARAPRGAAARVVVTAANAGRRDTRPCQVLVAIGDTTVRLRVPRVGAGGRWHGYAAAPTSRRGTFPVGPVRVARLDPYGLWVRRSAGASAGSLLVHPVVASLPAGDPVPGARHDETAHRLREYAVGDDVRTVHWRSSARAGTLLVRQVDPPAAASLTVLLDARPVDGDQAEEMFETLLDTVATVLCACAGRRVPFQLLVPGGRGLRGAGRPAERARILDALAGTVPYTGGRRLAEQPVERPVERSVEPSVEQPGEPLRAALASDAAGPGAMLAVVTGHDLTGPGHRPALRQACRRYGRTVLVQVGTGRPPRLGVTGLTGVTVLPVDDLAGLVAAWPLVAGPPGAGPLGAGPRARATQAGRRR